MIRLLAAGIDSLYWSARGETTLFPALLRAKVDAEKYSGPAMPWASVDGFTFSMLPYAKPGCPIALDCAEFRAWTARETLSQSGRQTPTAAPGAND